MSLPPRAMTLPDPDRELAQRLLLKEWAAVHAALTQFFESYDVEEEGTAGVGIMASAYRKAHAALTAAGVKIAPIPPRAMAVLEAPPPS